jgi:hypothetical protein
MKRFILFFAAVSLLLLPACDSFVENVEEPKESTGSESLNSPVEARFIVQGIQAKWADTHDFITLSASLLSDQFRFGLNSDATFPTYFQLDAGIPERQSNTVDAVAQELGQYRFLADDAVRRFNQEIEFDETATLTQNEALFAAHLHGAIARYYYATYIGLNPQQGGGVIERSEFIPSNAMYDSARVKVQQALDVAPDSSSMAFANSVLAKINLYDGQYESSRYDAAADVIEDGPVLEAGSDPVNVLYSVQEENEWWQNAGISRVQVVAQDSLLRQSVAASHRTDIELRAFDGVIENNPDELARVPLVGVTARAGFVEFGSPEAVEAAQNKYPQNTSPIPFINWQEVNLIRAELALRGASNEDPLALINEVRTSYGLGTLSSLGSNMTERMETLAAERDRTLFAQGDRLADQRRLDVLPWHLVDTFQAQETWRWIPISQAEIDDNPNLNPEQ